MDPQKLRRRSHASRPFERHAEERPLHLRDHRVVEVGEGLAPQPIEERGELLRAQFLERALGHLQTAPLPRRLEAVAVDEPRVDDGQVGISKPRLQAGLPGRDPFHVKARARQRLGQLVVGAIRSQQGTHGAHPAATLARAQAAFGLHLCAACR